MYGERGPADEQTGAAIALQLFHAGRYALADSPGEVVAPSPIASRVSRLGLSRPTQSPPARRVHPRSYVTGMRVLRRDRLGGLIHEYSQVA